MKWKVKNLMKRPKFQKIQINLQEKNTPTYKSKQNTSDSNETTTNSQNENESSKKDEAKNPLNDSQTKIQTPENPCSEIQSRLLSEGKSVGDMSWQTHFSFSSNNKNFSGDMSKCNQRYYKKRSW